MSSVIPNDDVDDVDDEARFRAQAAALAAALRRADERQAAAGTTTASSYSVEDTYRQFCFDEPLVTATSEECHALAQALVDDASPYALSNRLVQGVAHLVDHHRHNRTTTTAAPQSPSSGTATAETTTDETSSLLHPTTGNDDDDDTSGVTHLAWTVFGRIPLLILLSDHLEQAAAYLGSFRVASVVEDATTDNPRSHHDNNDDDEIHEALRKAATRHETEEGPTANTPRAYDSNTEYDVDVDDDLQEVWAAESDPSDYEYGTDDELPAQPQQQRRSTADLDVTAWTFSVEPLRLSQPPTRRDDDTTWSDVAAAVTHLLRRCNYHACLASRGSHVATWKRVTSKLTQLCLTLLLPSTMEGPLFRQYPDAHWQQLALTVLHAFRDAVQQHQTTQTALSTTTTTAKWLWEEYLRLLVLLLQADHHTATKDASSSSMSASIAPATLVGLSALSSLCQSSLEEPSSSSTTHSARISLRDTVLQVADDLASILEHADPQEPVVPWTFLAVWQVLYTAPRNNSNNSNSSAPPLTAAHAQILLQSGMVRQWMLLWQKTTAPGGAKPILLQRAMEDVVWHLCCVSPTLIGKYVWRFAGFAAHVTDPASSSFRTIFLWNLLGIQLAAQQPSSAGGLVSLKKNNGNTQQQPAIRSAPTETVCRQQAVQSFRDMCQRIVDSLTEWKNRRERSVLDNDDNAQIPDETKQLFEDWQKVVESLSIPLVQRLFLEQLVQPVDNDFDVNALVAPIRKILVAWPSPKSHEDTKENVVADEDHDGKPKVKEEKPSDDTDQPKRKRGRKQVEDEMVASLRKSIKVLQSTLESGGSVGGARFSSKAD